MNNRAIRQSSPSCVTRLLLNSRTCLISEDRDLKAEASQIRKKIRLRRRSAHGESPSPRIVTQQESSPGCAEDYESLWWEHDRCWEVFAADPPRAINFSMIPFPPCDDDVFEFVRRHKTDGDRRAAYRLASMRWHPDKFMQLFGNRLQPQEIDRIICRVKCISQSINRDYSKQIPPSSTLRPH
jgi:hypothetical protein